MKTGEASFEVSPFRKDGSTLPLSVQAKIGNWGDKKVVLSIASDITKSKETDNVREKNSNKIAGILRERRQHRYFAIFNLVAGTANGDADI